MSRQLRAVVWAGTALVGIWLVALAGYQIAKGFKVTAEKVQAYIASVDFGKLTGEARARALQELADMLNKLSPEERRRLRGERMVEKWFAQMTEEEKGQFIEATMPTGFKQMIAAFEEQPEEKRRKSIDEALKRLRESQGRPQPGRAITDPNNTNAPPPLSPELEAKVRSIGLKTFYSQSSAQTKAELAPVLEELQNVMESGRFNRR